MTLLLLAAGPFSALGAELHVGAGEHDTLLLGALILWLVTLRLRGRGGLRTQLALDAGVGLAIGVALWCDFLILPFALAAALALMLRAVWRFYASRERTLRMRLGAEAGVAAAFFLIGLAPLLLANIASGGATFREVFGTANSPSVQFSPPLPPGLAGAAQALYLQIAATLLAGSAACDGNRRGLWLLRHLAAANQWRSGWRYHLGSGRLGRVHGLRDSLLGVGGASPRA